MIHRFRPRTWSRPLPEDAISWHGVAGSSMIGRCAFLMDKPDRQATFGAPSGRRPILVPLPWERLYPFPRQPVRLPLFPDEEPESPEEEKKRKASKAV